MKVHIPAFIRLLPKRLQVGALTIARWSLDEITDLADSLFMFLVFVVGTTIAGILISSIGYVPYAWDWPNWVKTTGDVLIWFGNLLVAITGAIAGFLWVYIMARIAALTGIALTLAKAVPELVKLASRPLPSTPIILPKVITAEGAEKFIRFAASVFAAIAGGSAYATVFPVYTNLPAFLGIITMFFFIAFMVYGWQMKPKWPVKEWLVMAAFFFVLFQTLMFVMPASIKRELGLDFKYHTQQFAQNRSAQRELAEFAQANQDTELQNRKNAIATINQEIDEIDAEFAHNGGKLSPDKAERRGELEARKAKIVTHGISEVNRVPKRDNSNPLDFVPFGGWGALVLGLAVIVFVFFK